jgi:hypothetical protein
MNPSVDVGTSPCQFEQAISGNMAWLCQFPGANSPEQQCESSVNNALHYVTQGFGGQLTNIGGAAAIIAKYFPASTIGQLIAGAAKGIAGVAFGELLIDALGALALAEIAIALVGQDNIAYGLCSLIHINDGPLVLHLITAEQDLGLGILSFAPTPTYDAGTVTVSDPATTDCPCVAGVCGSFNVIYSPLCGVVGDCVCVTDVDGQGVCKFPLLYTKSASKGFGLSTLACSFIPPRYITTLRHPLPGFADSCFLNRCGGCVLCRRGCVWQRRRLSRRCMLGQ